MDIGYFLKLMTEKNASDMFLTTGAPVYIKVEGKLYPLGNTGLPAGMVKKIAYSLMDEGQVPAFERDLEFNMAIAVKDTGRFRVNVFKQRSEVAMVIRSIRNTIPSIEELQLPQVLKQIIMAPRGRPNCRPSRPIRRWAGWPAWSGCRPARPWRMPARRAGATASTSWPWPTCAWKPPAWPPRPNCWPPRPNSSTASATRS
jgi:hypothetical protein